MLTWAVVAAMKRYTNLGFTIVLAMCLDAWVLIEFARALGRHV